MVMADSNALMVIEDSSLYDYPMVEHDFGIKGFATFTGGLILGLYLASPGVFSIDSLYTDRCSKYRWMLA